MQQNDFFIVIEENGMNAAIPHNQPYSNHRTHGIHRKVFNEHTLITDTIILPKYRSHELKSLLFLFVLYTPVLIIRHG